MRENVALVRDLFQAGGQRGDLEVGVRRARGGDRRGKPLPGHSPLRVTRGGAAIPLTPGLSPQAARARAAERLAGRVLQDVCPAPFRALREAQGFVRC